MSAHNPRKPKNQICGGYELRRPSHFFIRADVAAVFAGFADLRKKTLDKNGSQITWGPIRFRSFDVSAHVTVLMSSPCSTYCHTVLQYDSNILRAS